MSDCLFCEIVRGDVDAEIVDRGDGWVAFRDIHAQAPTHVLVVPEEHVARVHDLEPGNDALAGRLLRAATGVAEAEGLAEDGYRLVINNGRGAGQSVFHLHVHVLGGRELSWPPG